MLPVPTIRKYMTLAPKTIAYDQTLDQANEYMRKLHVRHLPVIKGDQLIGIITDRDIHLLWTLNEVSALSLKVEFAMTPNPYLTTSNTSIADVANKMASHNYGSTLVVDNGRLVGIFTCIDALRALADVFTNENVEQNI